jgi:hypothetical protein
MYLTGLIHRDRLFDVASRWLADRVQRSDGRVVTEIFCFERMITAPAVRSLVADLGIALRSGPLFAQRVGSKDAVRQAIAAVAGRSTPRARTLVEEYRRRPEEFFPRTPVHMTLVTKGSGELFAVIRRKRLRRIAEKSSRRVAEELAGVIESTARELAARRAQAAGVGLDQLLSTPAIMEEEFMAAERLVADRIRTGQVRLDASRVRVNDVIGVKVVGTPAELETVERRLVGRSGTTVNHREQHDGSYVGTHLLVDLELPSTAVIADGMRAVDWSFAAGRGLSPSALETDFYEYLESGSRSVRIELVLTTFEDLVESEFGRSIHEVRILDQRNHPRYAGRIAQNASYIIEYLLHVAISPTVTVEELPIKVWGRYLRDTLSDALQRLHHEDTAEWARPGNDHGRHPLV